VTSSGEQQQQKQRGQEKQITASRIHLGVCDDLCAYYTLHATKALLLPPTPHLQRLVLAHFHDAQLHTQSRKARTTHPTPHPTFSLSLPATASALFNSPTTKPPPLFPPFPASAAVAGAASPQPSHSNRALSFSYLMNV
jgi:hypothetical protein